MIGLCTFFADMTKIEEKEFFSRTEKRENKERKSASRSALLRAGIITLVIVVVLLNLSAHVLPVVRYYGSGMEDTLHNGQTLVVFKTTELSEGDIAVFYYNNKVIVRRVVCTGGKQISIDEQGTVFINGEEIIEDYVKEKSLGQCNITFPQSVPVGHVFVMGDVRDETMDSRLSEIGTIPKERIIGKVLFAF